jgi:hypothetical protein
MLVVDEVESGRGGGIVVGTGAGIRATSELLFDAGVADSGPWEQLADEMPRSPIIKTRAKDGPFDMVTSGDGEGRSADEKRAGSKADEGRLERVTLSHPSLA